MLVAQNLNLDMARVDDELLDEHAVVAEGRLGLGLGAGEAFLHLAFGIGDAHALAAATGGSLDHDGVADLARDPHGLIRVLDDAHVAGHGGHMCRGGGLLGFDLVAHRVDGARIGTDEGNAGSSQRLGEGGAFGQEAIARMHGLGAGLLASLHDLLDQQVGLGGGGRADVHLLVGHFHMEGARVGVGIDRHGPDTHAAGGLDDAAGDFAAIGDENLLEHGTPELAFRDKVLDRTGHPGNHTKGEPCPQTFPAFFRFLRYRRRNERSK